MPVVAPRAFSHVTIRVRDMARAHDFYARVLGYTVYIDNRGGRPLSNMLGLVGGVTLELVELPQTEPKAREASGFHCVSFRVDDIDAALKALRVEGLVALDKPIELYGVRLILFEDPEGNVLELIEYPGNAGSIHDLRGPISEAITGLQ